MMLNEEITRLKNTLNTLIAKNADYAEILKVSRELDKLIAKVMNQKHTPSDTTTGSKE
ncbi:MAG: Spo0E like sporulation regulatory protein [Clostridia bacterium]|jgi:uncharacterized protein YdcH (DUF465 family)|nr:Spo0E like sporulation regulatory protein [Clostridia bacterium]